MNSKESSKKWLTAVLAVIFVIGIAAEVLLKYASASLSFTGQAFSFGEAGRLFNKVMYDFGQEALPIWALPSVVLNLMLVNPWAPWAGLLRWIPYFIAFLLPVICAGRRKKGSLLFIPAALSLYEGISIYIVSVSVSQPWFTYPDAFPFFVEGVLLILAAIALNARAKGLAVVLGVISVICAVLSPMITASLNGFASSAFLLGYKGSVFTYMRMMIQRFPTAYAASVWPAFKTFAFIMYAFLLFACPRRRKAGRG